MVDRTRDQTRPELQTPVAAPEPQPITARDVVAYLRQNPDFLDRHPEALRVLHPPTRAMPAEDGETVLDFQHFLLDRQRRDLVRLNGEHRTLIATSRGNLASQSRVHKAAVAILAASSFETSLQIATTDLAVLLDVDVVTIGVESAATHPARLPLAGIRLLKTGTVDGCSARIGRRCCKRTYLATPPCSAAAPGWCARRRCCGCRSAAKRLPVCCASGPESRAVSIRGSAPSC